MRAGVHFHGKLKTVRKDEAFNDITIEISLDRSVIDLLEKLEMLDRSFIGMLTDIEVTIAND